MKKTLKFYFVFIYSSQDLLNIYPEVYVPEIFTIGFIIIRFILDILIDGFRNMILIHKRKILLSSFISQFFFRELEEGINMLYENLSERKFLSVFHEDKFYFLNSFGASTFKR